MEKKDLNWSELSFSYVDTDYRFSAVFEDGEWSEGELITSSQMSVHEGSPVLHYAQTGSGKRQVQYMDESGDKPEPVETIEEADRVTFSLWGVYGSELRAFIGAVESHGEDPDAVIIPSGKPWNDYLATNTLPTE